MGGSLTECQPPIAVARGVESQERSRLTHVLDRRAQLVAVDDYNQFGSCQAIWRLDDGYVAASDPRRAGGWGVAGVLAAVVPGSTHTSRSRHPLMTTPGRE
jgi:hypothetical protein